MQGTGATGCVDIPLHPPTTRKMRKHDNVKDCIDCLEGQNSGRGAQICSICLAGTFTFFNETSNATQCIDCAAGMFQPESGNRSCVRCPNGYYQDRKGLPYCLPCIPGTYANGSTTCTACPAGYHAPPPPLLLLRRVQDRHLRANDVPHVFRMSFAHHLAAPSHPFRGRLLLCAGILGAACDECPATPSAAPAPLPRRHSYKVPWQWKQMRRRA